jgi:glycolate oxidase iron-sulfur subunit
MTAVHEGVVGVDEQFAEIIDFCLGCRACEPVCPGLVPYGRALEGARAEIEAQVGGRADLLLKRVIPSRRLLGLGSVGLSAAQRLRLTGMVPRRLRGVLRGVRPLRDRGPAVVGSEAGTGSAGTVALVTGCIQDEWFRPVNRAAARLLAAAGYRVEAPEGQTCCGALAAHSGKAGIASTLAVTNTQALSGYDHVVATAAGCSAHLRGYGHWAAGGEDLAARALDVTVLVSTAIDRGLLPTLPGQREPIAIQDPCHLRHAQRVTWEPRHLLEAAGHQVVEIDGAGMCCGAAGLYSMLQPEASGRLGEQKAAQVRATGLMRVASANPGCEMQLRAHLGEGFIIAHPIEWYLRALEDSGLVSPET